MACVDPCRVVVAQTLELILAGPPNHEAPLVVLEENCYRFRGLGLAKKKHSFGMGISDGLFNTDSNRQALCQRQVCGFLH